MSDLDLERLVGGLADQLLAAEPILGAVAVVPAPVYLAWQAGALSNHPALAHRTATAPDLDLVADLERTRCA